MENNDLRKIAEILNAAGIPSKFEPGQSQLLIKVWREVAKGSPVSMENVKRFSSGINISEESTHSFIKQVGEFDKQGNIVGIVGLSQNKHPHRFRVKDIELSTWCAWDSLFLPIMIDQKAIIESKCPVSGEQIRITVSPNGVDKIDPTESVLSIVIPDVTKQGPKVVQELWMVFCHRVYFFKSAKVAQSWLSDQKFKATILSIKEGFELGRLTFSDLIKFV